jgi:hypothetical protein
MSEEKTQQQNPAERKKAKELSLEPTKPPAQIDGYRITAFLGSGAYGEVWSGIDQNTGRRVAIKFYTRRSKSDVALLAQEVEKLVVLAADRYVVQLLDVGWDSTPPYYVMDYIEHGSLEDRLQEHQKIPVDDAVDMFEEIATGLMHLHGKGVLHCDIKPGNILLDQDNKPRLADFGQSRLSTEGTAALGTLYYMAPEQADLEAMPDAKWDVYALGAILYSMLTGEPPYRDKALSEKIETTRDTRSRLKIYRDTIRNAPKPTAHRKIPGVDRSLGDIIDRCINPQPKKRFASVQSVLLALRQRQESIAFRPLLMLGLVGPLMLMAVMALFGWYAYQRAVGDTDAAVTQKAIESNSFAARLAARSASEQIDKYMLAVKSLADDSVWQAELANIFEDESLMELRCQLTDPNQNTNPDFDTTRSQFESHPVRQKLQRLLASRLKQDDMPGAASWWIYDPFGIQMASVFEKPPSTPTRGKNYSYRSYFTGSKTDLIDETEGAKRKYTVSDDFSNRPHVDRLHVSAIFFSDATATWKIAFSSPVYHRSEFVGVIGLTVEMGDFVEFDKVDTQYAMMVDGRPGKHQGIVLEHPLFTRLLKEEKNPKLDASLTHCQVDMDSIQLDNVDEADLELRFMDPIGEKELGEAYRSVRIAAGAEIQFSVFNKTEEDSEEEKVEKQETGLYVIAVEDYATIVGPAEKLGRQLAWLGSLASLLLLLVALGLWFLVLKSTRDSRQRLARVFSPSSETSSSSSLQSLETVALPTKKKSS